MSDFSFIDEAVAAVTNPLVVPLMSFANDYWWPLWCVLFFIGFLLTLAPWQLPTEHNSFQAVAHVVRRSIFYVGFVAIALFPFIYYVFDITFNKSIQNSNQFFINWFLKSFNQYKYYIVGSAFAGSFLRFYYFRFFHPWISSTLRDFRNKQSNESESDIRTERLKYNPKNFDPHSFYVPKFKQIFLGLDSNNKPIYVPESTWLETNMMITGPTRYGKGVVIGCLMEQAIRRGDQLIYIDPKNDKFAAKIMLQTCAELDRPFYYVSLSDDSVGYWSPFEGGKRRDAYNRLISIFGMTENSGDADFYKAMEKKVFNRLIKMDDPFDIEFIYKKVKYHNETVQDDADKLLKIEAQLENWRQVPSLNPIKGFVGFSLEKAMLENAVIYFQGSLNDEVIKTATKSFILEVIQECMRLDLQRKSHLTFIIDEVRFLVSKTLADALATIVGFRVNIVTACQSINDLKTPDDINLDGEATYRSISTNSQLKLVYGGADSDTAEWVAKLSGSIVKEVTSMERVTVKPAGAEEWERGRTIKPLQEALIPENVALTLPPRVCVVFRPSELATVTFTSPVPVKDMNALSNWLNSVSEKEKQEILSVKKQKEDFHLASIKKIEENILNEVQEITPIEDILSPQMPEQTNNINKDKTTLEKNKTQFSVEEIINRQAATSHQLKWLFSKKHPQRYEELQQKDSDLAEQLSSQYKALATTKKDVQPDTSNLSCPKDAALEDTSSPELANNTNIEDAINSKLTSPFSVEMILRNRSASPEQLNWLFHHRKPYRFEQLQQKDSDLAEQLSSQYKTTLDAEKIFSSQNPKTSQSFIDVILRNRAASPEQLNWLFHHRKPYRFEQLQQKDSELAEQLSSQYKALATTKC
ncbi:MAG TPA: type IV secretion system DNA-binding domain-containing protein [Agitococcus sp.]|nr:type IV secretion system DNA-binding domain-containing protein [Agitococcus sp.]